MLPIIFYVAKEMAERIAVLDKGKVEKTNFSKEIFFYLINKGG